MTTDKDSFFVAANLVKGSGKLSVIEGPNTSPGESQLMSLKNAHDLAADIRDSLNMKTFVCQLYWSTESEKP